LASIPYRVPGVYHEPQPRAAEEPLARTDVVGFLGFDPRVRNGTIPSELTGSPPTGHAFRVDVTPFQLVIGTVSGTPPSPSDPVLGGVRAAVPAATNFVLSENIATIPIADGESIVYALIVRETAGGFALAAVGGAPAASDTERAPSDGDIVLALGLGAKGRWGRISDVTVRRELDAVFVTARPAVRLSITRCDDFRDYVLSFGSPVDDGTLLGPAVRAFFANGGRRCWVATLRRPDFIDGKELAKVLAEMVGTEGASELEATGLERLLLLPEVTVADAPDLYAMRVDRTTRSLPLPPSEREACFLPCSEIPPKGTAVSNDRNPATTPIFESSPPYDGTVTNDVFETQKALLARCLEERWRVLLLLSVPRMPDGGSGPYVPPTSDDAAGWLGQFDRLVKVDGFAPTEELSCAALYWPWVLTQEQVGAPVLEVAPSAYAAGVIARRDLARGPQISPANETLREVVGLTEAFGDAIHGALYDPDPDPNGFPVPAVNVLRAFPGFGIQVWGARTLSTEPSLRFVAVRRTLTAIELRMKAALDPLVFEPNAPFLWLQVTQAAFGVLIPLFESGALRGTRPEEAFTVRCDARNNPPEALARGELLVEVGVAIAAPAEFLIFRIGRREGVVEVLE